MNILFHGSREWRITCEAEGCSTLFHSVNGSKVCPRCEDAPFLKKSKNIKPLNSIKESG